MTDIIPKASYYNSNYVGEDIDYAVKRSLDNEENIKDLSSEITIQKERINTNEADIKTKLSKQSGKNSIYTNNENDVASISEYSVGVKESTFVKRDSKGRINTNTSSINSYEEDNAVSYGSLKNIGGKTGVVPVMNSETSDRHRQIAFFPYSSRANLYSETNFPLRKKNGSLLANTNFDEVDEDEKNQVLINYGYLTSHLIDFMYLHKIYFASASTSEYYLYIGVRSNVSKNIANLLSDELDAFFKTGLIIYFDYYYGNDAYAKKVLNPIDVDISASLNSWKITTGLVWDSDPVFQIVSESLSRGLENVDLGAPDAIYDTVVLLE